MACFVRYFRLSSRSSAFAVRHDWIACLSAEWYEHVQELHALKALELREHLLREMAKAQARAAHREA